MRLSVFTTVTSPNLRGDNPTPALLSYKNLADEVVVVDGSMQGDNPDKKWMEELGHYTGIDTDNEMWHEPRIDKRVINEWPKEFVWPFFGQQFQRGFEACTGDWVIKTDLDYIFRENDFDNIRRTLEQNSDKPALSFWKYQFILPDRYNIKSRLVIAVNKARFGDRIKFDGGGDLCQVTLDGEHLKADNTLEARIPFYNYEKILKTKEQIAADQGRMERAWYRHFGEYQMGSDGTDESAYERWHEAQRGKFNKPQQQIKLPAHPIYIQETIRNLKPENFGYNGFGLIEGRVYA